jgi:hypothetical protein
MAPGGTGGGDPEPLCWDEPQLRAQEAGATIFTTCLFWTAPKPGREWWRRRVFPIVGTTQSESVVGCDLNLVKRLIKKVSSAMRRIDMLIATSSRCATPRGGGLLRHGPAR